MPEVEIRPDTLRIRELYGEIAVAASTRNKPDWLACWAQDAVWHTEHFERSGRQDISDQWDAIWKDFDKVVVLNEIGGFEDSGHRVKVKCAVLEIISLTNGSLLNMAGVYADEVALENGRWRFASRTYNLVGHWPTA